jgi:hypothetical protein
MKPLISPRHMHEGQRSEIGAIRRLERTVELLTRRVAELEAIRERGTVKLIDDYELPKRRKNAQAEKAR